MSTLYVQGERTPAEHEAHERKLFEAMKWMAQKGIERIDREEHGKALLRQVIVWARAEDKAGGA